MTEEQRRLAEGFAQGILLDDPGFLRQIVKRAIQELLEAEMNTEHVGAALYERSEGRTGRPPQRPQAKGLAHQGGHPQVPPPRPAKTVKVPSPCGSSPATCETRRHWL
jgi:hypothetical protein